MDGTKSSSFSYFWRTSNYQGDEKLCEVKKKKGLPTATKNLTELFFIKESKPIPACFTITGMLDFLSPMPSVGQQKFYILLHYSYRSQRAYLSIK
jgi:hypothetical protein